VPGIASAGLAGGPPLAAAAERGRAPYQVPGRAPSGAAPLAVTDVVSDGYFETLGVPLLAGRDFDLRDVPGASPVAGINRTVAEHVSPGASPLGAHLVIGREPQTLDLTVVGVVGDVRSLGLDVAVPDEIYLAYGQSSSARVHVFARGATAALESLPSV